MSDEDSSIARGDPTDDHMPWGWICDGRWRPIPKRPMLDEFLGPPPFKVRLPDGQEREIVHEPTA